MSNATPSRLGFINATSDGSFTQDNALFLKVFAGEVLTAFEETNVMKNLHLMRTITHGKSAQFPATWKADAVYHTPGNRLLGTQKIKHAERIINIDDLLVSDVFIANIDEAKNHYDVRSIYSSELGHALARKFDKQCLQVVILAARNAATISGANGGSVITHANYATDGEKLAEGIFKAAQILDEKDVPENDRYVIVRPEQYYLLAQTTKVLNRDWGGSGVYADGTVLKVAGVHIVKSNNVPNSVVASEPGTNNTYDGDFTKTVGVVFHKSAMGTVKLMDLAVESEYMIDLQGTLMVAKYAMGHGILRPEAAVEIALPAS
jgi:hypothetical protein